MPPAPLMFHERVHALSRTIPRAKVAINWNLSLAHGLRFCLNGEGRNVRLLEKSCAVDTRR